MNYIDIIIILLLVGFGIGGWRKGIITEVATLLGLGFGLYGAFHFSDFTAAKLMQWIEINPKYLNVISFLVTFIVLAVLVNLLGRLVAKLVKSINLGFIDRIGGFVVGIAKGLLICSLLVMLLNTLQLKGIVKDKAKQESVLYPYVEMAVPYVYQGFDMVKEAVQNASGDNASGDGTPDAGAPDENAPENDSPDQSTVKKIFV